MTLTQEDISAITNSVEVRLDPRFKSIETRLDSLETSLEKVHDRLGRIEVFVPVENAYALHDLDERLKKIMDKPVQ